MSCECGTSSTGRGAHQRFHALTGQKHLKELRLGHGKRALGSTRRPSLQNQTVLPNAFYARRWCQPEHFSYRRPRSRGGFVRLGHTPCHRWPRTDGTSRILGVKSARRPDGMVGRMGGYPCRLRRPCVSRRLSCRQVLPVLPNGVSDVSPGLIVPSDLGPTGKPWLTRYASGQLTSQGNPTILVAEVGSPTQ